MTQVLTYYAKEFVNLRVDEACGVALHEPILLLTLLDLFEKGQSYCNEQCCAFCKVRVVGWDGMNMMDRAHIQPFAEFRDEHFVNGLAPCKKHRWTFDHSWFAIDDDYQILISWDRFIE